MTRLLVIGSASLDTNHIGARRCRKLGGTVTYAGLTARRLGLDVSIVTGIGRGDEALLEPLRRHGLEVHARRGDSSTRFVNRIDGDHRSQRLESAAEPIRAADL